MVSIYYILWYNKGGQICNDLLKCVKYLQKREIFLKKLRRQNNNNNINAPPASMPFAFLPTICSPSVQCCSKTNTNTHNTTHHYHH